MFDLVARRKMTRIMHHEERGTTLIEGKKRGVKSNMDNSQIYDNFTKSIFE